MSKEAKGLFLYFVVSAAVLCSTDKTQGGSSLPNAKSAKDVVRAVPHNSSFVYNMREDGWTLKLEGPKHPPRTPLECLEFAFLLCSAKVRIGGAEVQEQAKDLGTCLGQHTAEYLLNQQGKIPKCIQGNSLVFAGTVWFNNEGSLVLPYLHFSNGRWVMSFESAFYYSDLLVRMVK